MAEALKLLRQYVTEKKEFTEDDENIIFGDIAYPKEAKTNYMIYETGVENKPKQYYTLGCLAYFIKKRDLLHPNYVRDAIAKNIPVVLRMDRIALLDYFDGKIDTNPSIDKNAPLEIQMLRPIQLSQVGLKRSLNVTSNDGSSSLSKKKKLDSIDLEQDQTAINQKMKLKIEQKLTDQSSAYSAIKISEDKGLSENLSAEKIKLLKQKHLAKKQNTIISGENDNDLIEQSIDKPLKDTGNDELADLTKEILSRERNWRNRVTILESTGKTFDKNIFAILQSIKTKEENGLNDQKSQIQSSNGIKQTATQQKPTTKPLGYNRFGQEQYASKDETGGFSIDTKRSYQFTGSLTLGSGTSESSTIASKSPLQTQSSTQPSSKQTQSSKRSSNRPIIIIPSARTSLITLFNVLDILQDLKYVPSEEKRKMVTQSNKDYEIINHRREDGKSLQFKVIDDVNKLSKEDWDRVVAAFAHGPAWQFKNWPWDGNPSEIFSHLKGFHLKWNGINSDTNISKMPVQIIELDQNRRHLDRARLLNFWEELDK